MGFKMCWSDCWLRVLRSASIIPAVIRPVRDAKGKIQIHITVPVQNGWKAIALSAGARQELFISTAWTKEQLAAAIQKVFAG